MINTFNTVGYTVAGKRHLSMGKENEDGYSVYEDERLIAICAADGCSASPCAKTASEYVLKALIEFAKGDIWGLKKKQIKNTVLKIIDKYLLSAPYEYRLLACTCILIVYNKVTDSYIAISIGDCQAVVMTDDLEPQQLLAPVNIFGHREQTVFANSSMAANAMKVEFGSASNVAGFIIISDGAERLFDVSNADDLIQLSSICVLSEDNAQIALEEHISNVIATATNDDITVLMTMRSNSEKITSIAEAKSNNTFSDDLDGDSELQEYKDDEKNSDSDDPEDCADSTDVGRSSELLSFLATPRTAEELIVAGYCIPSEVLTYLFPLVKEGVVIYNDYHFAYVKEENHV